MHFALIITDNPRALEIRCISAVLNRAGYRPRLVIMALHEGCYPAEARQLIAYLRPLGKCVVWGSSVLHIAQFKAKPFINLNPARKTGTAHFAHSENAIPRSSRHYIQTPFSMRVQ